MKKNNGKLILFLCGLLMLAGLSAFGGLKLSDSLNLDREYGEGHKLVYQLDTSDNEIIAKTATVIENRVRNFGADYVETKIDGSKVTVDFTGVDDLENLRKGMTLKGEISLRNNKDELLAGREILNENVPLLSMSDGDKHYYYLNIADGEKFGEITKTIAASTDKYMALWCDWAEGDKFPSDTDLNNLKYDNEHFAGLVYITSSTKEPITVYSFLDKDATGNLVRLIDGGQLPVTLKEVSFEALPALNGAKALKTVIITVIAAMVVIGLCLALFYGLAGGIAALLGVTYAFLFFKATALLDVIFNSELLAALGILFASGLVPYILTLRRFRAGLVRGRNLQVSLKNAYKETHALSWIAGVCVFAVGGATYVLFRTKLYAAAVLAMTGGVLNMLVMVFLARLILMAMADSNYFDRGLFGISVDKLPDVDKGENYNEEEEKIFDFTNLLKGNVLLYAAIVIIIAAVSLLVIRHSYDGLWQTMLMAVLAVAGLAALNYRKYPLLAATSLCFAAIGCIGFLSSHQIGLAYVAAAAGIIVVTHAELLKAYRRIMREKLNEEKLLKLADSFLNDLCKVTGLALAAELVLAIASLIGGAKFLIMLEGIVGGVIVVFAATLILAVNWIDRAKKDADRKPAKGKNKKQKKELSEHTIFGINEAR